MSGKFFIVIAAKTVSSLWFFRNDKMAVGEIQELFPVKFITGLLNCILIFRGIDDAMFHMENSPIQSFFLEVIGFQERMGIMYFAKAGRKTAAFNAVGHRFLLK